MTNNEIDFTVDKTNLYREENYIDLKTASIRCLIPITPDGAVDESREKIFVGHTQLMSPQGPVPLHAPLQASSLEDAMEKYPDAMHHAMAEMIENAKKMHQEREQANQQESSRIVVPGQ
jgi:hypothetical protein